MYTGEPGLYIRFYMITICNSPNPKKNSSSFNVYGRLISQCRFTYATRRPGARCFWVEGWRPASCGLAFPPKVIESALLACCFDTPIVVMFRFFVGKAWHFEMLYIFGTVLTWYWHLSFFPFQSCLSMFRLIFLHSNLCKLPWTLTLIPWPLFWATSDWDSVHIKYVW